MKSQLNPTGKIRWLKSGMQLTRLNKLPNKPEEPSKTQTLKAKSLIVSFP